MFFSVDKDLTEDVVTKMQTLCAGGDPVPCAWCGTATENPVCLQFEGAELAEHVTLDTTLILPVCPVCAEDNERSDLRELVLDDLEEVGDGGWRKLEPGVHAFYSDERGKGARKQAEETDRPLIELHISRRPRVTEFVRAARDVNRQFREQMGDEPIEDQEWMHGAFGDIYRRYSTDWTGEAEPFEEDVFRSALCLAVRIYAERHTASKDFDVIVMEAAGVAVDALLTYTEGEALPAVSWIDWYEGELKPVNQEWLESASLTGVFTFIKDLAEIRGDELPPEFENLFDLPNDFPGGDDE